MQRLNGMMVLLHPLVVKYIVHRDLSFQAPASIDEHELVITLHH